MSPCTDSGETAQWQRQEDRINGVTWCVTFGDSALLTQGRSSEVRPGCCIRKAFLFPAEWCSAVWRDHSLLSHLPAEEHGLTPARRWTNKAAIHTRQQATWDCDFPSLWEEGDTGSRGSWMFTLSRNYQAIFLNGRPLSSPTSNTRVVPVLHVVRTWRCRDFILAKLTGRCQQPAGLQFVFPRWLRRWTSGKVNASVLVGKILIHDPTFCIKCEAEVEICVFASGLSGLRRPVDRAVPRPQTCFGTTVHNQMAVFTWASVWVLRSVRRSLCLSLRQQHTVLSTVTI